MTEGMRGSIGRLTRRSHTPEDVGSNPGPASNILRKPISLGAIVIVRYYDHVLYHDASDLSLMKPVVRETVGWLDYEDTEHIRLVWERYAEAIIGNESRFRTTGLAIRKSDIIELRRLRGSL